MRAHLLLAPVLSATALLVGCEWTSSDGITWDESYNSVNFSGTYNLGNGLEESSGQNITKTKQSGDEVKSKTYGAGVTSGSVGGGIVPGSVTVVATAHYAEASGWKEYEASFADNGSGALEGAKGNGTISYGTGSWAIPTEWVKELDGNNGSYGDPVVTKTVVRWRTEGVTNETITVQYVTVHQTGQNLTMTFNNGYTFSGKISGFNTDSESIEHATSVIAKFNVSGDQGKIVGSLNSLASSRQLDGVWTRGGSSHAIVGSAIGTGRTISSNTTAVDGD